MSVADRGLGVGSIFKTGGWRVCSNYWGIIQPPMEAGAVWNNVYHEYEFIITDYC